MEGATGCVLIGGSHPNAGLVSRSRWPRVIGVAFDQSRGWSKAEANSVGGGRRFRGGRLRFAAITLVGLVACFGLGAQAKDASRSDHEGTTRSLVRSHSHSTTHAAPKSSSHNSTRSSFGSHPHNSPHTAPTRSSHGKAAPGVARDAHGKIARSPQALLQFKNSHACPGTGKTYGSCPGYVVDHVVPLKRGGADAPNNMQWQTKQAAKQKDRWE